MAHLLRLLFVAVLLRFYLVNFMSSGYPLWARIAAIFIILGLGAVYVLRGTAEIIEETTEVLSEKTKIASGLLQSLGTAFPDMVMGIVAAIVSLQLRTTNYPLAISFAIIAAATTFGSNIYNIGYAIWCVFRQNLANQKNRAVNMFPFTSRGGQVTPMQNHRTLPSIHELDTSIDVLNTLTLLTSTVAVSMVIFGRVAHPPVGTIGDLYQLIRPVGGVILALCIGIMVYFRKTRKATSPVSEIEAEEKYYRKQPILVTLLHLFISGIAILLAAESMIRAVQIFCEITGTPLVIAGALAGVIGCLGEILVIHNYTTNPQGRIGDALVGVAMDNIVTTLGAAIVAVIGGIFLGGNALILIFVLILTLNSVLLWQISRLKNFFLSYKSTRP